MIVDSRQALPLLKGSRTSDNTGRIPLTLSAQDLLLQEDGRWEMRLRSHSSQGRPNPSPKLQVSTEIDLDTDLLSVASSEHDGPALLQETICRPPSRGKIKQQQQQQQLHHEEDNQEDNLDNLPQQQQQTTTVSSKQPNVVQNKRSSVLRRDSISISSAPARCRTPEDDNNNTYATTTPASKHSVSSSSSSSECRNANSSSSNENNHQSDTHVVVTTSIPVHLSPSSSCSKKAYADGDRRRHYLHLRNGRIRVPSAEFVKSGNMEMGYWEISYWTGRQEFFGKAIPILDNPSFQMPLPKCVALDFGKCVNAQNPALFLEGVID